MKKSAIFYFSFRLLFLSVLFLVSCKSSTLITSTYSGKEDLKKYKSFDWALTDHRLDTIKNINAKAVELTIKKEVNRRLVKKGFVMQRSEPDLIVDFIFLVNIKYSYSRELESERLNIALKEWDPPTTKYLQSPEVYNPKKSLDQEYILVENQDKEESLTILFKDRKTGQCIWEVNCLQTLLVDEDIVVGLPSTIRKLFKKWPKGTH